MLQGILWQKQENQLEHQSYFQFFWTHLRPWLIQLDGEMECKQSEHGVESIKSALEQGWGYQSWHFSPSIESQWMIGTLQ